MRSLTCLLLRLPPTVTTSGRPVRRHTITIVVIISIIITGRLGVDKPSNPGYGAFADAGPHRWNSLPTDVRRFDFILGHLLPETENVLLEAPALSDCCF